MHQYSLGDFDHKAGRQDAPFTQHSGQARGKAAFELQGRKVHGDICVAKAGKARNAIEIGDCIFKNKIADRGNRSVFFRNAD
ncbi:hypothetical protein D3C73_916530 [compost metagenome]